LLIGRNVSLINRQTTAHIIKPFYRLYANIGNNESPNMTSEHILRRLRNSTVAIVGLGGVGSWSAEALCRSGVGNIILIDLDDICISNTNRQLHALTSSVGRMKIDEMKRRLLDINPGCNVTLIHDFVTVEAAEELITSLKPKLTACIDAIDGMYEKTALILACVNHSVPIVTCGGAAGRMDPTQIVIDDLTKAQEDRLLFSCRKLLRQGYGFPKVEVPAPGGKKTRTRSWRIPAVYSTEVQQKVDSTKIEAMASSFRACDGALGTGVFVTGT
jgi:tRNA A37 threonylcarbamoyladenosine dehydratase